MTPVESAGFCLKEGEGDGDADLRRVRRVMVAQVSTAGRLSGVGGVLVAAGTVYEHFHKLSFVYSTFMFLYKYTESEEIRYYIELGFAEIFNIAYCMLRDKFACPTTPRSPIGGKGSRNGFFRTPPSVPPG